MGDTQSTSIDESQPATETNTVTNDLSKSKKETLQDTLHGVETIQNAIQRETSAGSKTADKSPPISPSSQLDTKKLSNEVSNQKNIRVGTNGETNQQQPTYIPKNDAASHGAPTAEVRNELNGVKDGKSTITAPSSLGSDKVEDKEGYQHKSLELNCKEQLVKEEKLDIKIGKTSSEAIGEPTTQDAPQLVEKMVPKIHQDIQVKVDSELLEIKNEANITARVVTSGEERNTHKEKQSDDSQQVGAGKLQDSSTMHDKPDATQTLITTNPNEKTKESTAVGKVTEEAIKHDASLRSPTDKQYAHPTKDKSSIQKEKIAKRHSKTQQKIGSLVEPKKNLYDKRFKEQQHNESKYINGIKGTSKTNQRGSKDFDRKRSKSGVNQKAETTIVKTGAPKKYQSAILKDKSNVKAPQLFPGLTAGEEDGKPNADIGNNEKFGGKTANAPKGSKQVATEELRKANVDMVAIEENSEATKKAISNEEKSVEIEIKSGSQNVSEPATTVNSNSTITKEGKVTQENTKRRLHSQEKNKGTKGTTNFPQIAQENLTSSSNQSFEKKHGQRVKRKKVADHFEEPKLQETSQDMLRIEEEVLVAFRKLFEEVTFKVSSNESIFGSLFQEMTDESSDELIFGSLFDEETGSQSSEESIFGELFNELSYEERKELDNSDDWRKKSGSILDFVDMQLARYLTLDGVSDILKGALNLEVPSTRASSISNNENFSTDKSGKLDEAQVTLNSTGKMGEMSNIPGRITVYDTAVEDTAKIQTESKIEEEFLKKQSHGFLGSIGNVVDLVNEGNEQRQASNWFNWFG